MSQVPITFGDNVRVRDTPITRARSLSGRNGQVFGYTTPSITRVEVIGELLTDYAISVHFKDSGLSFWFAPELLEFMDHAPRTTVKVGEGKEWTRQTDGSWREKAAVAGPSRPWWKLW
jgi:hypothetical protein